MVFSGLSTVWRLASWPTRRSPVLVNATTEGVKRLPSLLMITVGFPPSITATTEFVVPRSMPTAFAIPHLTSLVSGLPHRDVSATRYHPSWGGGWLSPYPNRDARLPAQEQSHSPGPADVHLYPLSTFYLHSKSRANFSRF